MLDNHFVPDGYGIIPYFSIFGKEIPSYSVFVGLSLIVGITWFLITVPKKEPAAEAVDPSYTLLFLTKVSL